MTNVERAILRNVRTVMGVKCSIRANVSTPSGGARYGQGAVAGVTLGRVEVSRDVLARPSAEEVGTVASADDVPASIAAQNVVAGVAEQRVVSRVAEHQVGVRRPDDHVVTTGAGVDGEARRGVGDPVSDADRQDSDTRRTTWRLDDHRALLTRAVHGHVVDRQHVLVRAGDADHDLV